MQRHGTSVYDCYLPLFPTSLGVITTIDEVCLHPPLVLRLRNINFSPLETIAVPFQTFADSVLTVEGTSHQPFFSYVDCCSGEMTLTDNCLGYIGEFEIVDDHRSGKIVIQLNGRLNKTGVISPRYNVQVNQIEAWVNLLLPARGFGIIILVSSLDYDM